MGVESRAEPTIKGPRDAGLDVPQRGLVDRPATYVVGTNAGYLGWGVSLGLQHDVELFTYFGSNGTGRDLLD